MGKEPKKTNLSHSNLLNYSFEVDPDVVCLRDLKRSLLVIRPETDEIFKMEGLGAILLPILKPGIPVIDLLTMLEPRLSRQPEFQKQALAFIRKIERQGLIRRIRND